MTLTTQVLSPDALALFDREAAQLADQFRVPGVSVAVVTPDQAHFLNLGVTSVTNPLPVTEDTLYQIGSTTKTMTALTLALLEQEGALHLDDRVKRHLPDLALQDAGVAEAVTLLDLLTHQGGWMGDYFEDTGNGDDALAEVVRRMAGIPQIVPLRGAWGYNNAGFYLAGRVIEVVTGLTYEAAVTRYVLTPLGMTDSLFFPNQIMTRRFAAGHALEGETPQVLPDWQMMRSGAPAGSTLSCTARDMARYARYLMTGEGVQAETPLARFDRQSLFRPRVDIGAMGGDTRAQMGLAWWLGRDMIRHGGGTEGHVTAFVIYPAHQLAFIAHSNSQEGGGFNAALEKVLYTQVLNLPPVTPPDAALDVPDLPAFEGAFEASTNHPAGQRTLHVQVRGDALTFQLPREVTGEALAVLRFFQADMAAVQGGPVNGGVVQFFRDQRGQVAALRLGGRLFPRRGVALPVTL